MRSIIGHILAAVPAIRHSPEVSNIEPQVHPDDALRAYFLDESQPIPQNVKIYYWPYPSDERAIVPGLGLMLNEKQGMMGHLLKFFPVAYFVVFQTFGAMTLDVPQVHGGDGCSDPNCEVSLRFNFRRTPEISWPEAPGPQHSTIMLAELATFVKPRNLDRKRRAP